MPVSLENIQLQLNELTNRFNQLIQNTKNTGELQLLESPNFNELIRVYDGLTSKRITLSQIGGSVESNNLIKEKYISSSQVNNAPPVDNQDDDILTQKVAYVINNLPTFSVSKDQIFVFNLITNSTPTSSLEILYYFFKAGKGTYGDGGANIVASQILKGIPSKSTPNIVNLGDIGEDNISEVVNSSGPYNTEQSSFFSAIIDEETHLFVYQGSSDIIGLGNTQTNINDFEDITNQQAIPENETNNYLGTSSLYSKATYYAIDEIANFDFSEPTEDFIMVYDEDTDIHHFCQRKTEGASFENSKVFFPVDNYKTILGSAISETNYNRWEITGAGFPQETPQEIYFQYWKRTPDREIWIIDDEKFTFNKGITAGVKNTGENIEVNDLALNGVFYDSETSRWYKGDLKCIDNTGDLSTGILTKWQPQDGATPLT